MEQELLTLPEHLNSPPVFSGVRVTRSLVLYAVFCRLLFVLFLLAIVLSVLPFTDSDYYIGIKLFFFVYILLLFIFFFFALLFQLQYSFKVILPGIWHIYNTKDILT